jgi:guanine nucleotide-binding protein alpha-1 subunit
MHISLSVPGDPLSRAMAPPPDESPEQRQQRLREEKEAKLVNDEIDAELKHRKAFLKEYSKAVRVLLLGEPRSPYPNREH